MDVYLKAAHAKFDAQSSYIRDLNDMVEIVRNEAIVSDKSLEELVLKPIYGQPNLAFECNFTGKTKHMIYEEKKAMGRKRDLFTEE